jgi:hypothetical protein
MRGNYTYFLMSSRAATDAVEKACALHKEACELRLAKATNTPKNKVNTPWPTEEKPKNP